MEIPSIVKRLGLDIREVIMKTLEEFNNDRRKEIEAAKRMLEPHPNGIACPECGEELWDSDPRFVLASSPPKLCVNCKKCDYIGYRLA